MTKRTITINGTVYDAETGNILRVERSVAREKTSQPSDAKRIQPQKSHTLQRRYIAKAKPATSQAVAVKKQPAATPQPARPTIQHHQAPRRPARIATHPDVVRFARTVKPAPRAKSDTPDIAPTNHVLIQATKQRQDAVKKSVQRAVLPSEVIKKQAIESATKKMPTKTHRKEVKQPKQRSKFRQFSRAASVSLAVMLLGAYFTYLNMPALSTRIAATQAGINASYPSYQPSGYSLNGPVAYERGSVIMNFASNGSAEKFTLAQTQSNWDSSAVLENYVKPNSGDKYTTSTVNGLTVYTYDTTSVWVNAGILYTVNGNAQLAPNQIERLATSL